MTTMRRKFRFKLRFGLGLAGGLAALALMAPGANAQGPKPTPTPGTAAADQYAAPTVVSFVTLTAAKAGKCKKAVTVRMAPKKKACKGKKACLAKLAKEETAADKACDRAAAAATKPKPAKKP